MVFYGKFMVFLWFFCGKFTSWLGGGRGRGRPGVGAGGPEQGLGGQGRGQKGRGRGQKGRGRGQANPGREGRGEGRDGGSRNQSTELVLLARDFGLPSQSVTVAS